MIRVEKFGLVLVAILFVFGAVADDTTISPTNSTTNDTSAPLLCRAVCGETDDGVPIALSNPDFVVEYQWNSRVPTCAGKSCQSGTCSEFELRLPSFNLEDDDCKEHQAGIQEAGCECSSGGSCSAHGCTHMWILATLTIGIVNFLI